MDIENSIAYNPPKPSKNQFCDRTAALSLERQGIQYKRTNHIRDEVATNKYPLDTSTNASFVSAAQGEGTDNIGKPYPIESMTDTEGFNREDITEKEDSNAGNNP